jgi:hypothetical protein
LIIDVRQATEPTAGHAEWRAFQGDAWRYARRHVHPRCHGGELSVERAPQSEPIADYARVFEACGTTDRARLCALPAADADVRVQVAS